VCIVALQHVFRFFQSKHYLGEELITQQHMIRRAMGTLIIVIKYDRDLIMVEGRANLNEIIVSVPHTPYLVIAFMIAIVTRPNFVRP
jgi:hypothetical protein